MLFAALLMLLMLAGCRTQRTVTTTEDHRQTTDIRSLDSLLRLRLTERTDSAWQQSVLRQFQQIRERSDTSHTVVLDTAGQVIRERTVINNYRETQSDTYRHDIERLTQRIVTLDSTLHLMTLQQQTTDSLLRSRQQTVEVAAPLTFWQQTRLHIANIALLALLLFAGYRVVRWKFLKR